jgi:hypothetical protein
MPFVPSEVEAWAARTRPDPSRSPPRFPQSERAPTAMPPAPFASPDRADHAAWGSAAFACATMAENASPSCIAMSASTLRSSSMPASFRPCMNWL